MSYDNSPKPDQLYTAFMRAKAELLRQLVEVGRQIDHGDKIIAAQRRIVASLTDHGKDATQEQSLLRDFELAQGLWLGEMDRLLNLLDRMPVNQEAA